MKLKRAIRKFKVKEIVLKHKKQPIFVGNKKELKKFFKSNQIKHHFSYDKEQIKNFKKSFYNSNIALIKRKYRSRIATSFIIEDKYLSKYLFYSLYVVELILK